jgi:integrase
MSGLSDRVSDYLAMRRAVGYKLDREGRMLADFVRFAERCGAGTVTTELAVSWARLPVDVSPVWAAKRLGVVRGFAAYLATVDAEAEVPARDVLPCRTRRTTPYLYSDDDITALMAAARSLVNPLKAARFETLIGLLAVTGMRGGEAMRLDRQDVDWQARLLLVRDTKFGKSRRIHLHPTTIEVLRRYSRRRDRLCPSPSTASLLVSTTGRRLCHATVQPVFRELLRRSGIEPTNGRRPRVHDVRHSFAVKTLLGWYRDGSEVQARMPALSTHLGHVDPGSTYWYLTAAPELLALAAERLQAAFPSRP